MIIFMGLAGSGKTTQGQLLAAHLHCPWVSTGNLLREYNTDEQVQKQMLKGEIISDDITLSVLDAELKRISANKNECVLDGSPRTIRQAEWLVDKVKKNELYITAVIHLKTSEKTAKIRLLARHRPDDYETAIAERFSEYQSAIRPILSYLQAQGFAVLQVEGEKPAEQTAADIQRVLKV